MARTIDINCDCGESFGLWTMGNDEAMMDLVTSVNVACGFHAGDPSTMAHAVETAADKGVAIGAHPGLPDLLGFGRRPMRLSPEDVYTYVLYQAGALKAMLAARGLPLHHVKPHGALLPLIRDSAPHGEAAIAAIVAVLDEPCIFWPITAGDEFLRAAEDARVRIVGELYADMSYAADGNLVSEVKKSAPDVAAVREKVKVFLARGEVYSTDGAAVAIEAESICLHGDAPNAIEVAQAVVETLEEAGVGVRGA